MLRALARKRGECFLGEEDTFLTEEETGNLKSLSITDLIKYPISAELASIRSLETIGSAAPILPCESHKSARRKGLQKVD